jgi:hypothetical protein
LEEEAMINIVMTSVLSVLQLIDGKAEYTAVGLGATSGWFTAVGTNI